MKREGRIHKGVSIGAYSILIAFMLLLLWTVLRYPGNHLIPWQMALGVAAATVLLLAAGAAWNKIYTVTGRRNSLYAAALVLFGVLLYVVSLSRQGNENTLLDYTYVYRDALNLANGRELEDTNYFLTYSNNLKPMLLLSVLFRMALLMDVSPFYFVLLRNVILVMLVACACGYLAERNGDTCWRFPILLAFVFLLPMWEMTAVFYTDSMSFGMGILGLAFLKLAAASSGKRRQTLWALLAAGMAVLAGTWKITVIIPLIACAVILLWQRVLVDRRVTLLFGGFVVILGVALQLWANSYEITKEASETANPVISWVALGMKEDGSWTNNREFVDHMYEFSTRQEKQQYSMEYIRENRSEFWNPVHLRKKASYNFANGNLGASAFLNVEYSDGTLLWEMFSPWGKYYWRTCQYCFCYLVSMYVLLLIGMILSLRNIIRDQEPPVMLMICQLGFIGIVVFLMFWEASGRQMYNQMPGILLGSVLSIEYFWKNLSLKPRK